MRKGLDERVVGATIAGKYRVRRVVGAGSMGVVCEAEHLEIGKRLAIKLIDASLAGMRDIAMRFRQEARAASLVESHHIVQVFDVGTDDELGLYLVMEYLTGEDLAQLLAREGRLPADDAVRIAVHAARGLAKAHEAGVVHRDLKPANIFLCEREDDEPLVKILDFGISKIVDASRADSRLRLTRAGTVVGTPQYMSPEQAQGYAVDERTDVWALGLVLYEMLAGRPAYPELPTYEQFIIHLVSHPPDPLLAVAPWVPAPLAGVVHQAIEHDLAARIPTCAELGRRLLEAHPVTGVRPAPSGAEAADTWADESVRSPYVDDDRGVDASAPGDDVLPPSRTVVMTELPFGTGPSIDVDVDATTGPPPAVAARAVAAAPASLAASSSGVGARAGTLARSGVRGPGGEASEAGEGDEDAPQFFDRRSLEPLSSPPAPPSGPVSARASIPADPSAAAVASAPAPGAAPALAPSPRDPARPALAWAAMAFIALGLVIAVALALR